MVNVSDSGIAEDEILSPREDLQLELAHHPQSLLHRELTPGPETEKLPAGDRDEKENCPRQPGAVPSFEEDDHLWKILPQRTENCPRKEGEGGNIEFAISEYTANLFPSLATDQHSCGRNLTLSSDKWKAVLKPKKDYLLSTVNVPVLLKGAPTSQQKEKSFISPGQILPIVDNDTSLPSPDDSSMFQLEFPAEILSRSWGVDPTILNTIKKPTRLVTQREPPGQEMTIGRHQRPHHFDKFSNRKICFNLPFD
jgi:hypothetical protein